MNKVILMGNLTREPEIRYSAGDNSMAIARFSIAVNRRFKRQNDQADADFFNCTAFGKTGEFVEKYLHQGSKVLVMGRIQNDNYTNRDGQKVYSVQVIVEEIEFAESRAAASSNQGSRPGSSYQAPAGRPTPAQASPVGDDFMNIPESVDDEELPFI